MEYFLSDGMVFPLVPLGVRIGKAEMVVLGNINFGGMPW